MELYEKPLNYNFNKYYFIINKFPNLIKKKFEDKSIINYRVRIKYFLMFKL